MPHFGHLVVVVAVVIAVVAVVGVIILAVRCENRVWEQKTKLHNPNGN